MTIERGAVGEKGDDVAVVSMMRRVKNKYDLKSLAKFTPATSSELRARGRDGSTIYARVYEARD